MRTRRLTLVAGLAGSALALSSTGVAVTQSPAPSLDDADTLAGQPSASVAEWTRLDGGPWASEEFAMLVSAGNTPDGRVVVVGSMPYGRPTAWSSDDAVMWHTATPAKAEELASSWLLETPWGLDLRQSTNNMVTLRWTTDDAHNWGKPTRAKKTYVATGAALDEGVVLAGATGTQRKMVPALWHSSDGDTYEKLSLKSARKTGSAGGVAKLPDGRLLVTTGDWSSRTPKLHVGTWDGGWKTLRIPAAAKKKPWSLSLATVDDGVVLSVYDGKRSTLWHTSDGVDWEELVDIKKPQKLVHSKDRLYSIPSLLSSSDGRAWCRLPSLAADRDTELTDITTLADGRLLVVGFEIRKKKNHTDIVPRAWVASEPECAPLDAEATNTAADEDPLDITEPTPAAASE